MKKVIFIIILCLLSLAWGQETQNFDPAGEVEDSFEETSLELAKPMQDIESETTKKESLLDSEYIQKIIGEKAREVVMEYIKENPFSKMSKLEVETLILNQAKGKPAEKLIEKFPNGFNTFIAWLRDPKAIPAFLGIVNKPRVFKNYGIAVIVIFIISFALNLLNTKGRLLSRIFKKIVIMFGALTLNLGLFYIFFKPELQPTLDIIAKHLF